MSTTSEVVTFAGAANSVAMNSGGALNNLNLTAQLAAAAASEAAALNPLLASTSIMANGTALSTGIAALANDIHLGADKGTILADLATLVGDTAGVVGGIAELIPTPQAQAVGRAASFVGGAATVAGVAAEDYNVATNFINTNQSVQSLVNQVKTSITQIQSMENTLSSDLQNANSTVISTWNSTETTISQALQDISNTVNSVSSGSFASDANISANDLGNTETALSNMSVTAGVSPQALTETETGNQITVNGAGSTPVMTDTINNSTSGGTTDVAISETANGSSASFSNYYDNSGDLVEGLNVNPDSSTLTSFYNPSLNDALTEEKFLNPDSSYSDTQFNLGNGTWESNTSDYNASHQLTESVLVNKDNTSDITSFSLANASQRQDIYSASGQITGSEVDATDGSKDILSYNTSGGTVFGTETDLNSSGQVTQTFLLSDDGSYLKTTYVNGQPSGTTYSMTGGELVDGLGSTPGQSMTATPSQEATFNGFVTTVGSTVATQILQLLLKNNLPESLVAGAGLAGTISAVDQLIESFDPAKTYQVQTSAGTLTITEAQAFLASFGTALAGGVGGIAGSELGAAFFKAIGLPAEVGSQIGGVVGAAGAVAIASEVAQSLNLTNNAISFSTALTSIGGAAVGSFLGSELSSLIIGSGNTGSQIGGAVGTAVGAYIALPLLETPLGLPLLILDTFAGNFIGSLIGDIFGGLFGGHASVGPNAISLVDVANGSFYRGGDGADNGGDVTIARSMANSAVTALNALLQGMGSTAVSSPEIGFGFIYGHFTYGLNGPTYGANNFSTAQAAVEAGVISMARATVAQGGNVYMQLALNTSNATTLANFISDINAAYSYSVYIQNPLAFDVALAKNNDPTAYATWQNQLSRIQAMGLDQYAHGTLQMATPVTTLTSAVKTVVVNGNVAGSETITPAAGSAFTLELAAGTTASNLWFSRNGNELTIEFNNSGHQTTIKNYFTSNVLMQSIVFATDGSAMGSNLINSAINTDPGVTNALNGSGNTNGAFVIGTATNFLGMGETGTLVRAGNGQIGVAEYNSSHQLTAIYWSATQGTTAASTVALTNAQFTSLSAIMAPSGGMTIQVTQDGTYDLSTKTVTGVVNLDASQATGYVTLRGTAVGEIIKGGSGNNTMESLGGAETLNGGTGTNIFQAAYTAAGTAGTVMNGGTGPNQLNTWDIDLSTMTLNNIPALYAYQNWVGMSAAEFANFTSLSAPSNAITLKAETAGTYDLTTYSVTGTFIIFAIGSSGNVSMVANAAGETLTGGSGNDNFTATSGADTLIGGSGNDTFYVSWTPNGIAGTTINGGGGTNNISTWNGDLSVITFSNIQTLNSYQNWVKMTAAQFAALSTLNAPSNAITLKAATDGTYDLSTKTVTGVFNIDASATTGYDTLRGTAAGEVLTAGSGHDTLESLGGAETLNGGSGVNVFQAAWTPTSTAGTVINGGTGTNELDTWDYDLSTITVNNVSKLVASQNWVKMTAAQFAAFTSLTASGNTITLKAANAGTYDLTSKSVTGAFNIDASGATGNVTMVANAAGETLTGGSGNDNFTATSGADTLVGGSGNDTFYVSWTPNGIAGTTINGNGGSNNISTWDGDLSVITFSNIQTLNSSNNWVKMTAAQFASLSTLNAPSNAIKLEAANAGTYDMTTKSGSGVFNLSGAYTSANVTLIGNNAAGETLTGGAGTDILTAGNGNGNILYGGSGNTTMNDGTGNDNFYGGTGYNTYKFGTTFGQDTINNAYAGNTTAKGEADFASGITDENLWFKQTGNDLEIDLLGTSDKITVSGWFNGNAGTHVQTFNAGGLKLDSQVSQLVAAMATYSANNNSFNPATATSMPTNSTLQTAIAAAWHS